MRTYEPIIDKGVAALVIALAHKGVLTAEDLDAAIEYIRRAIPPNDAVTLSWLMGCVRAIQVRDAQQRPRGTRRCSFCGADKPIEDLDPSPVAPMVVICGDCRAKD